eukprot:CAMPEP_0116027304 /NCGR_PEP_ID=MMETSP0321-20121206/14545_1 /TAXON_ID=163516 /ORGANISM="Leptocylindrus danicus var. danicus, Strain B650" /LENGTH=169 /DNA_ID=CAMNT_0003500625 /DNA_START=114 /DNA_END=623 /DNA_ORIENTATION=+
MITKRPNPNSKQHAARLTLDNKLSESVPSRTTLEALAVECASEPSPDNTFQYAFCLTKSAKADERRYAISILDNLVKEGYEHQVDCIYGAAIALYLNGTYAAAREKCEAILRAEPDQAPAVELHLACLDAIEEENAKNVEKVVIGGSAAIAGVGLALGIAGLLLGGSKR